MFVFEIAFLVFVGLRLGCEVFVIFEGFYFKVEGEVLGVCIYGVRFLNFLGFCVLRFEFEVIE